MTVGFISGGGLTESRMSDTLEPGREKRERTGGRWKRGGALAILFGLVALVFPRMSLGALVLAFGIYAAAEGALLLTTGIRWRNEASRWITLLEGGAGITAGIAALAWPRITAVVLLLIIVVWALATGMLELGGALVLRKEPKGEWLLILSGLVSLLFAYMLLAKPAVGALVFLSVIGIYAVTYGLLQIALDSRVRRMFHA